MKSREDLVDELVDLMEEIKFMCWSARRDICEILGQVCSYSDLERIREQLKIYIEGEKDVDS